MPGMNGEFVPNSKLAQSNFHHHAMGSSHRNQPEIPENLHRPMHEFMNDEELRRHLEHEITLVREERLKFGGHEDNERFRKMYKMLYEDFLLPDLKYLDSIKRLPEGIKLLSLISELKMPD